MRSNPAEQYSFPHSHSVAEALAAAQNGQEIPVAIAGRLLGRRDQGRLYFGDVRDDSGEEVQIVATTDTPEFEGLKAANVGDWVGIYGTTGKTRRGEPSVFAQDWALLAATEVNFPDKRTGITSEEIRARQRYLDLATNVISLERFKARSQIVAGVRDYLHTRGFMEVETPYLHTVHGGASARPFTTHHNALDLELSLRIAPELPLKRLVVGGLTRVFEIGRNFRNEGISPRHNPEFTSMEVYAAYWDYEDQMRLTEELIQKLALQQHGTTEITYQGRTIDLSAPWPRRTMDSLVSDAVGKDVTIETPVRTLKSLCKKHGVELKPTDGPGAMLVGLYEKLVEGNLEGPIFVTDYPQEVSPLARSHRSRPGYTERFEGIVAGREICNGYTELNNAREQYQRFLDQAKLEGIDDEAMPMDDDYVRALQYGLPPTAGLGIGIDRLVMLLTDTNNIRDVILFPTMRPDGFKARYED